MSVQVPCDNCGCVRVGERWDVETKRFYLVCAECGRRRSGKLTRRTKRKRAKRGTKSKSR